MSAPKSLYGNLTRITNLKWQIQKADLMNKQVGEFLTLPTFYALNVKWRIKLYSRGLNEEDLDMLAITLELINCKKLFQAKIEFSILSDNECFVRRESKISSNASTWKYANLSNYSYLMSDYVDKMLTLSWNFIPDVSMSVSEPSNVDNYFNNQQYSDVKFLVDGKHIYAHKIVLATKSNVFDAMFQHKMKENIDNLVNIEDIEYEVFLDLLRFIYSGNVEITDNNVKPLIFAADKYEVIDLKIDCSNYLVKNVAVYNIEEYLDLAELYGLGSLKHKVVDFILTSAREIINTARLELIAKSHPDVVVQLVRRLAETYPFK